MLAGQYPVQFCFQVNPRKQFGGGTGEIYELTRVGDHYYTSTRGEICYATANKHHWSTVHNRINIGMWIFVKSEIEKHNETLENIEEESMKKEFKVGQWWRLRNGEHKVCILTISEHMIIASPTLLRTSAVAEIGQYRVGYNTDGSYGGSKGVGDFDGEYDMVELISEPAPLCVDTPRGVNAPQVVDVPLGVNPKQAIGQQKIPMHLFSPLAIALGTLGKANGALKYGKANYLNTPVVASIYIDATFRHMQDYLNGNEFDSDGVPNLAGVLANADILASAGAAGTLVDDRPSAKGQLEAMEALIPIYNNLKELHKGKTPRNYYLADDKENTYE
jgi:hypothetical protein